MGEGHSNTTGHGARGPTGGVKGGPAGPGGPGSNVVRDGGRHKRPMVLSITTAQANSAMAVNEVGGVVAIVAVRLLLRIWRKTRNYKPIWLWEGCQPLSP